MNYCMARQSLPNRRINNSNILKIRVVRWRFSRSIINMQVTKALVLLYCLMLTIVASASQMSDAQLERTLTDRNTIQRHLKCALAEGPCDPVGRRLRTLAPLVLRGACPQCSPQETRQIRRTLAYVQRNYPWEWAKIVRQYG